MGGGAAAAAIITDRRSRPRGASASTHTACRICGFPRNAIPEGSPMVMTSIVPTLRLCYLAFAATSAYGIAAGLDYPPTPKQPVKETYHGVTVTDDYRWLEDDASPEVKRWVAEQNAFSRRYLDAVRERPAIAKQVESLLSTAPVRRYDFQYRGKLIFALKLQPPKNQPLLVTLPASG